MLETSVRLLRLLSLLQSRPEWPGGELAERLGVTTRTVRNDVERLRIMGYQIHSTTGPAGGYRLGAGAALPPLILDDEEAVAVAVSLHAAASGTVTGIEETALRALTKLQQMLPSRLRRRIDAMGAATVSVAGRGPTVDADTLTAIAGAIRDREQLRFDYRAHDGTSSLRAAEPPPRLHRTPLVPARLGHRQGGLAHLPRRPHHAPRPQRPAVRPPRAPG